MQDLSALIKQRAQSLGFDACGIARAQKLESHEVRFNKWLEHGFHGSMDYMTRNLEKRLNPGELLPGAKSVIVVTQNYFPQKNNQESQRISKYAYGVDYHHVIKKKLGMLIQYMEELAPGIQSRGFTDSAPVLERAWAVEAGLGWTGKNACMIIPKKGSFFFLAEIITTLAIEPNLPFTKNHCGNCTRCMDACPTGAIVSPGQIDARKCLSYLTIEHKEAIPREVKENNKGWIFGCDTCQDVCPHNRYSTPHTEPAFTPLHGIDTWTTQQWEHLEKSAFKAIFVKGSSPLGRVRYEKLKSNMQE